MFSGKKRRKAAEEEIFPAQPKDKLFEVLVYLGFALILYLFFKSVFAFALLPAGIIVYHRRSRKQLTEKYREMLNNQFKDALLSVSGALRAGYSMENALLESAKEMESMYGQEALICRQMRRMKSQLSVGMPVSFVFEDLAARSGAEDIETFAAVFAIAEKSGGDLVEIIQKTASDIASKIETQNEIAVVIRAKRLEQNIMMLMPPLIILYVDLTTGSMLDPLYTTLTGRLVMAACLAVYAVAYLLSAKVAKIKV